MASGHRLHKEVEKALGEAQASLIRSTNHLVFRLPNGATVVLSKTQRNTDNLWKRQVKDIRIAATSTVRIKTQ